MEQFYNAETYLKDANGMTIYDCSLKSKLIWVCSNSLHPPPVSRNTYGLIMFHVTLIHGIGVGRFRILGGGGGARFRILWGGQGGGQIPSRHMTS